MPRARKSCPYNPGCHCYKADCERCGFYPPVEEQRKLRLMNFKKWIKNSTTTSITLM